MHGIACRVSIITEMDVFTFTINAKKSTYLSTISFRNGPTSKIHGQGVSMHPLSRLTETLDICKYGCGYVMAPVTNCRYYYYYYYINIVYYNVSCLVYYMVSCYKIRN